MRKNKWFGLALVATMMGASFSACSNDAEEVLAQESEIKLTSEITPSRVVDPNLQSTQIAKGQQVGITITGAKGEHQDVIWNVGESGALTNTGSPIYWGDNSVTITAIHPYMKWYGHENGSISFDVAIDQSQESEYLNSDILYTRQTEAKTEGTIGLTFKHKLSKINVSLTSSDISDLSDANVYVCNTYTYGYIRVASGTVEVSDIYLNDIKAATTTTTAKASAIIIPQTINQGTVFIRIEHNNKSYYYKLPEDKTFVSGNSYNYTLNLNEKDELQLVSTAIDPWNSTTDIEEEIDEDIAESINVTTAGTLSSLISKEKKNTITSLKITGTLNADDISYIREMASRYDYGFDEVYIGNLNILDLSESSVSDKKISLYNVNMLRSIKLPNEISDLVLTGAQIESVDIPDGVGNIDLGYCSSLTNVNIPDGATSIYLTGCSSLTNVNIPNSAMKIDLSDCSSLKNVTIPAGIAILYDSNTTIPDETKALSLSRCESLLTINLPNSVTTIGEYAFMGCKSMTSINIPGTVETIGGSAFYECYSLVNVEIGSGVKTIGDGAFAGCSLSNITLPSTIAEICNYAFAGCTSLTKINSKATTPPTLGSDAFINTGSGLLTIYVPSSAVEAYKAATGWSNLNIVAEE